MTAISIPYILLYSHSGTYKGGRGVTGGVDGGIIYNTYDHAPQQYPICCPRLMYNPISLDQYGHIVIS